MNREPYKVKNMQNHLSDQIKEARPKISLSIKFMEDQRQRRSKLKLILTKFINQTIENLV